MNATAPAAGRGDSRAGAMDGRSPAPRMRGPAPTPTPTPRLRSPLTEGLPPLLWGVLLAAALACDHPAYVHLSVKSLTDRLSLEGNDWYRALRVMGYAGTWLGVAVTMALIDRSRALTGDHLPGGAKRRGVVLLLSVGLSAFAAEAFKVVIGRMRPEDTGGFYAFMPLADRFAHNSDLGMPSSHAAVAFAACIALALQIRAATPVLLAAAAGCGLTRVLAGAHFVSDVALAAWIAHAVCRAVWRLDAHNNAGRGLGEPGCEVTAGSARYTTDQGIAPRPGC